MKIKQINYNWRFSEEAGEEFYSAIIGYNGCTRIEEHLPQGEGDRLYYDVYVVKEFKEIGGYVDPTKTEMVRIFNPNQVFYVSE